MRHWLRRAAFVIAALLLLLTFVNASWLAPKPVGGPKLMAHRGLYQQFSHKDLDRYKTCTAARIDPPYHDYLENTVRSMRDARRIGADMIEMDIAVTADNKVAVFHDWTLECRTDGSGEIRERTMDELKTLDVGHGYTADGGKTYPFRGKFKGAMPTLEEALAALPNTPILFHFKSKDPREADVLAAALKAARRDVEEIGDAFYGGTAPTERMRHYYPKAWAWSLDSAKACTKEYFLYGWTSIVPGSCRNSTILIPLNYQWAAWGWPNRLIDRMKKVNARIIVSGDFGGDRENSGIHLPEQLGEVPASFNGYLWVEDIWTVGPARRPHRDFRTQAQIDAAEEGLRRRRERME